MKSKKKFSIVDIAIIFALIGIIGGIVFRTYNKNHLFGQSNKVTIEYTLEIKNTNKEVRKLINIGDDIHLISDNSSWGKIAGCHRETARVYETGENNNMIIVRNNSSLDITLNIRTDALKTKYGYMINTNTYIAPGFKSEFSTGKCEFEAQITGFTILSDNSVG